MINSVGASDAAAVLAQMRDHYLLPYFLPVVSRETVRGKFLEFGQEKKNIKFP